MDSYWTVPVVPEKSKIEKNNIKKVIGIIDRIKP
jgi:hypothetical protein